ncbi:hypothetical protein AB5J55_35055 [Streptomyces sp. R11]|uniref:Uncharacterized protein n=1 Tax=Streptomyces sp. R11 TaxID=3238625 RepID=A0AB39NBI0_9ACTN
MPKPKAPVLTPDQKARAIDQRNKEARKGLRGVARLNAKTVADAEARVARHFGLAELTPPKPKGGTR